MQIKLNSKSLLQRRGRISTSIQTFLDGVAIATVAWILVKNYVGEFTNQYVIMLLVLMGIVSIMYDHFAIYRTSSGYLEKMVKLLKAWTISFIILCLIGFFSHYSIDYPQALIVYLFIFGFIVQALLHYVFRFFTMILRDHVHQNEKAMIIGQGRLADYLVHKVSNNPWLGQTIEGYIPLEDESLLSTEQVLETPKAKNLGNIKDLSSIITSSGINVVYIITPLQQSKVLENIYFELLDKHVSIHWVPDIFSLRLINHSVREIAGIPVLTLSETPLTGFSKLAKSIEDFVLATLILILISPILIAIAVAVKLDSKGPVFFRQHRAGWNGKNFSIWKFRSMLVNQPKTNNSGLMQASKDDPRITKVGKFIRKTSLDELPQIFNVLVGDMSLVGPRPHALQHDVEYASRINAYYARHNIKPGITGLAQVRGYRGETANIDDMAKRVESDIEYINNWSLWLDLSILIRTSLAFTGKNAY